MVTEAGQQAELGVRPERAITLELGGVGWDGLTRLKNLNIADTKLTEKRLTTSRPHALDKHH